MIIYQVLPNRAFPFIISSLIGENLTSKDELVFDNSINYFNRCFEFCEIFNPKGLEELQKMYAYQTQVLRFHPDKKLPRLFKDVFHERYYDYIRYEGRFPSCPYLTDSELNMQIDFLYGLFSSERLIDCKYKDDFSFTFLDHPVDSVYNLYRYTKYVYSLGLEEFKDTYYNHPNLIGEIDYPGRNYIHYYDLFQKNTTLEKFIDNFINAEGKWIHNFFYFPISIYEEGTGRLSKLYKHHDFYGLVNTKDNLIASIKKFNSFSIFNNKNFKIDLNLFHSYFDSEKKQDNIYRRSDLEDLMIEDVKFFEEKEKELNAK